MDDQLRAELMQRDPKELLLFVLNHYNIEVVYEWGNRVETEGDFTIEIEGPLLYRLLWKDLLIAPYDNLDTLCATIVMELGREG